MPTIYQIIIVALATAFVILFTNKSGFRTKLRDYFDRKHIKLLADMLDCDFCFSFWVSIIVAIVFIVVTKDISYITTSIFSTPLIRFLL